MAKKDRKADVDASFLHLEELVVVQRSVDLASKLSSENAPMRKTKDKVRSG